MKAIVLKQVGEAALEDCEEPRIRDAGDAIVRVTTAGICGSDLHILYGRDPGVVAGTILGHEFVGVIEETGSEVRYLRKGDRVVSPFTINCGRCFYCFRNLPARCVLSQGFGFVTDDGSGLQGAQAEYVRVPLASSTLMPVPEGLADEEVLFLGDIFSTAYSCAEGASIRSGDVVAVLGCGPVGLLCVKAAFLMDASTVVAIDSIEYRRAKAKGMGANAVDLKAARVRIGQLTDGRGADAVLEAVGSPGALDLAIELSRPGAVISIAGYHTEPAYALPILEAYRKNLTFRIGRCNARTYMSKLLPLVLDRKVNFTDIITHTLSLSEGAHGYDIFANKKENAVKVLLKP